MKHSVVTEINTNSGSFIRFAIRFSRLESTSTRPSVIVSVERKAWNYGSNFFDGGKVTSHQAANVPLRA